MKLGDVIEGRYEVRSYIAEGSSAFVYRGYDRVAHHDVAIKVMKEELKQTMEHYESFLSEASFLANLRHINITRVYCLAYQDNQPCIIAEWMKGDTLSDYLAKQTFVPFIEAKRIMLQILDAIQYTHEKGYIHRDIKPQNIFYNPDGLIKLSDFGIAQDTGVKNKQQKIYGSIPYLAPEVIQGQPASKESDIYALGVTFYEILMGQLPFEGETLEEIAQKQILSPFPSINRKDIPYIEIDRILQKACAKNPLDRYKSAKEMMNDVQKLNDQPKKKKSFFFKLFHRGKKA